MSNSIDSLLNNYWSKCEALGYTDWTLRKHAYGEYTATIQAVGILDNTQEQWRLLFENTPDVFASSSISAVLALQKALEKIVNEPIS